MKGPLITLLAGAAGVVLAKYLHIPGGSFTGAMFAVAAVRLKLQGLEEPPRSMQILARVMFGLIIGIGVDKEALSAISESLPAVFLMVAALVVLSVLVARGVTRFSGLNYVTSVCGAAPGAASVMVIVAEDLDGDRSMVAVLHILRLSIIMISVPIILGGFFTNGIPLPAAARAVKELAPPGSAERLLKMVFLIAASIPAALLFRRFKVPAGEILAGIIVAAVANPLFLDLGKLPVSWQVFAQWIIGAAIGSHITRESLVVIKKYAFAGFVMTFVLIIIGFILGWILSLMTPMSFLTAIIGSCPGAMEAMIVLAGDMGANVPLVAAMHTLRLVVVILVAPVIVRREAARR